MLGPSHCVWHEMTELMTHHDCSRNWRFKTSPHALCVCVCDLLKPGVSGKSLLTVILDMFSKSKHILTYLGTCKPSATASQADTAS